MSGTEWQNATGPRHPRQILIHTRIAHLRIACRTITSFGPRPTDRGSDETGRVRIGSAVTKTGGGRDAQHLGMSCPQIDLDISQGSFIFVELN